MSVIGLYDGPDSAQEAADRLQREGFDRSRISITNSSDLGRFGVTPQDTDLYADAERRGGSLVILNSIDDGSASRAQRALEEAGALDVDEVSNALRADTGNSTLKVLREQLKIGKQQVQTGGVRVRSYVTEHPVNEQVALRQEHVQVERHPVDRPVDPNAIDTFREGTIEVRETAEVPIVSKEARIVEEIGIGKTAEQTSQRISDTVRETHVDIENLSNSNFDETYWRTQFDRNYGNTSGATWESYRPAYQYGLLARGRPEFSNVEWSTAEPRMREEWESRNPGTWDRYRDAIRSSYDYQTAGTGMSGSNQRAYADNAPAESKEEDHRGFFEKVADALTGNDIDDKTGRPVG